MIFKPEPYQTWGTDWLIERDSAALFAGMGLGKTAMTLNALNHLFRDGDITGALVIAPLRVSVLGWPYEMQKWSQFRWMKPALLRTKEGVQAWKDGSAQIYLLNYELIPKFCEECLKGRRKTQMPAQVVVWDELSKCKGHNSKRLNGSKRVVTDKATGEVKTIKKAGFRQFRDRFERHWGLTGTPRPNGYQDLFAQIRLLDDGAALGKSYDGFLCNFFEIENRHSAFPKYVVQEEAKGTINKRIADIALTLRSEDYLDIPPVNRETIEVNLPAKAMKAYKEVEKEFLTMLEDGTEITALNAGVAMNKLLQVTGGTVYDEDKNVGFVHDAKIKALQKLQKEIDEPLLVATGFIHEQNEIIKHCGAEKFNNSTPDRWNAGKIPMVVAHPASIGHGVDRLQGAGRTVVWFTTTWSTELYNQFNSRIARKGQDRETNIIHLAVPNTFDDVVIETVSRRSSDERDFLAAIKALQDLRKVA